MSHVLLLCNQVKPYYDPGNCSSDGESQEQMERGTSKNSSGATGEAPVQKSTPGGPGAATGGQQQAQQAVAARKLRGREQAPVSNADEPVQERRYPTRRRV